MSPPRQADPRIRVIAAAFCRAHTQGPGPCGWCTSRAREAVRALDDVPTLFDPGPAKVERLLVAPGVNRPGVARSDASDTSRAAALAAFPRSGTQRMAILRALLKSGPRNDDQIATATGLSLNTVRPRRGELVAGGWVCDNGDRDITGTGAMATRWALTGPAIVALVQEAGKREAS